MLEIAPVVLSFTSSPTGVKVGQNEIIRSSVLPSGRLELITQGYIGRMGLSRSGEFSKSGDFWVTAILAYDVALTEQQRGIIAAMLYERFQVDQQRSRPTAKNVIFVGDSIPAGYVTAGLYGMVPRLQEQFPAVRFGNYSVPGSQITPSVGTPFYGNTQEMFPGSVAPSLRYSKVKNILVVLGGGNDMLNPTAATPVTVTIAAPGVVTWTGHGLSTGQRVYFQRNDDILPTPLSFGPGIGPVYWVKQVLDPDSFTISATPSGAAINTSGTQSGTHLMVAYVKTAASVYAGIQSVVSQGLAAGATKVFVVKVLPRIGNEYAFVIDDLNTLIVNGAAGPPAYTVIDPYMNTCLATNPDPPGSTSPGACYFDSGHPNDLGHSTMATQVLAPALSADLN